MRCRVLVVLAIGSGLWACSGNAPSDASADNAGAAGNGGGVANGGAPVASAGGPPGSAGIAGASGSAASAAGASGDTSGTGSCPVWPRERLLPIIGPFFYGPDPGPCSNDNGDTFTYEAGRLVAIKDLRNVTTTYTYDAQGLPTGSTEIDRGSSVFEYGTDYVLTTDKNAFGEITSQVRYTLSPNGYPTTFTTTVGLQTRFGRYSYSNCRLLERRIEGEGTEAQSLSYEYDSAGHLTKRVCECFDATLLDYSCWK